MVLKRLFTPTNLEAHTLLNNISKKRGQTQYTIGKMSILALIYIS